MTNLIETFTVIVELNHCVGNSAALGGETDLRAEAVEAINHLLPHWLLTREMHAREEYKNGVTVKFFNTGLEEVPEETGGDN